MVKVLPGDVYYSSCTILFNPVSPYDTDKGFSNKAKMLFPSVYNKYRDYTDNAKIALGNIQLVYIGDHQFMMNGFCIDEEGKIDELALCVNLIELYNLATEYELSVAMQYGLDETDPVKEHDIKVITDTIFEDLKNADAELYFRQKR